MRDTEVIRTCCVPFGSVTFFQFDVKVVESRITYLGKKRRFLTRSRHQVLTSSPSAGTLDGG